MVIEVREAPFPVAHGWKQDGFETPHRDRRLAERFSMKMFVEWADSEFLPCRVLLSNGQTVIVRAKK